MKKLICLVLVICTVFSLAACGKKNVPAADETVFDFFMKAVKNGQYAEAYSFISPKIGVDNNTDEDAKVASNNITLAEFENTYSCFVSVFKISSMDYHVKEVSAVNDSKRTVSYSVEYNCEEAGTLRYDCETTIAVENGTWKVEWSPSLMLPDLDWNESFGRASLGAKRGDILTKDGTVIAETANLITVYAVFSELASDDVLAERIAARENIDAESAKKKISEYLLDTEKLNSLCSEELSMLYESVRKVIVLSEDETEDKLFKNVLNDFLLIKQFRIGEISAEEMAALEQIEGVHVDTKNYGNSRVYPYGTMLAHNLGYVGVATKDEVKTLNEGRAAEDGLYTTDSIVGKSGVERLYEKELRGKDGYYYFIKNEDGSIKKELFRKECENGLDVHLTIDFDTQKRTEELLDLVLFGSDTSGAVIVMNPTTGEVDAMASYPTYDLNKFIVGFDDGEYQAMAAQENAPFLDRTKRGLYPPGSTFKVFTAASALDLGVLNENYVFTGTIENDYWLPTGYGNWIWPRIKRTQVTNRTMPLNMENCMLHSDNIYFANAALKIGAERFTEYLEGLGMTSKLPFELTTASSQIISKNETMTYKLLADTGYGQGQVLVTPLQLAVMYCAFRNGGELPMPRITDSFYETDGVDYNCVYQSSYEPWITGAISQSTINKLIPMLQGVVDPEKNGTGRSLRVTNCEVAGKTGSAEIGDKTSIISWFAGFRLNVEQEDERVVIVMLDIPDTTQYSLLKFQIARQLLKFDDTPDLNAAPQIGYGE